MKRFNFLAAKWVSVLLASTFLAGCSLLPESSITMPAELAQTQGSSQKVIWSDSETKWLNWDLSQPNNQSAEWVYQQDAIMLNVNASSELNVFNQRSHTLVMKVVQLTDIAGVSGLVQTPGGIANVISQNLEMIPGAVYQDVYLVAPSQRITFRIARQENARFIAIAAGYAELDTKLATRILPIPVTTIVAEENQRSFFDIITFGLFEEEQEEVPDVIRPSEVELDVVLGPTSITTVNASAK